MLMRYLSVSQYQWNEAFLAFLFPKIRFISFRLKQLLLLSILVFFGVDQRFCIDFNPDVLGHCHLSFLFRNEYSPTG